MWNLLRIGHANSIAEMSFSISQHADKAITHQHQHTSFIPESFCDD